MSLSEAIGAYERGDYQKSRDLCREVLSPDLSRDDCAMAHAYLGHSLAKLGDQAGANEQFRRALSLEKKRDGRLHLHYVLGIGFRKLGDLAGAGRELQLAIDEFEESATPQSREELVYALSALGLLEYERGNYAAALAHAERACLTSVPESQDNQRVRVEAEVLRGQALGQLGRWEESIRILRNALPQLDQIEPGYAAELKGMAESFLGLGLCAVGQFEEALEILGRARLDRAKQPGLWAATRVWLGNLYYLRDDYPNALEQYEAIADRPAEEWAGSRESLARMADCYLETGRPERGLQVAEEAYREMRGNPLVHIVLAKALAIASRWEQADAVLHELNEDNLEEGLRQRFYAHAAYVAAGRGDRHRADHWLRRLRLRNPNSRYLGPIQDAIDRIGKRKSGFFGWLGRQN